MRDGNDGPPGTEGGIRDGGTGYYAAGGRRAAGIIGRGGFGFFGRGKGRTQITFAGETDAEAAERRATGGAGVRPEDHIPGARVGQSTPDGFGTGNEDERPGISVRRGGFRGGFGGGFADRSTGILGRQF